jgi:hypothetical protein
MSLVSRHRGKQLGARELDGLGRPLLIYQSLVGRLHASLQRSGILVGDELVGIPPRPVLRSQRFDTSRLRRQGDVSRSI